MNEAGENGGDSYIPDDWTRMACELPVGGHGEETCRPITLLHLRDDEGDHHEDSDHGHRLDPGITRSLDDRTACDSEASLAPTVDAADSPALVPTAASMTLPEAPSRRPSGEHDGSSDRSTRTSMVSWREVSHQGDANPHWLFKPLSLLGTGGMGEVYLAQQPVLDRNVAVKVLRSGRNLGARLQAFRDETLITSRLDHPNVIPVHDAGNDYMVMRRVAGDTLSDIIHDCRGNPGELPRLIEILRKICDAVAFAHSHGIIHRDLKPSNIMVGEFGEVMVMDWGLALALVNDGRGGWHPPNISHTMACAGTPAYLAPEMASGRPEFLGPASDVYLLGGVLYRILTGRPPYREEDVRDMVGKALRNDWIPVRELNNDAPARLVALQERAMARDPAHRGDTIGFRNALTDWLHSIESERRARTLGTEGEELLATACTSHDATTAYQGFNQATARFDQALGLWADCTAASTGRISCRRAFARAAINNGDLHLARTIIEELNSDPEQPLLFQELTAAVSERRRRKLHAIRLRLTVAALVLTAISGAAGFLLYSLRSQERARERRLQEATALLAQAQAIDIQRDHDLQMRLDLAYRARGLDPGNSLSGAIIHDAAATYAHHALEAGELDVAEAKIQQARGEDPDSASVAQLARKLESARSAATKAREREIARRRARLAAIADIRSGPRRKTTWHREAVTEIAAWDGDELRPDLIALLDHSEPIVQRLACKVLGERPDLEAGPAIVRLLDDDEGVVADAAWQALVQLQGAAVTPLMLDHLLRMDDWYQARYRGTSFDHRSQPIIDAALADDTRPPRIRARIALITGRYRRYLQTMGALAVRTPDELLRMARVAWWQLGDGHTTNNLARQAEVAEPSHFLPYALQLEIAGQEGDWDTCAAIVDRAVRRLDRLHYQHLLPWRILIAEHRDETETVIEGVNQILADPDRLHPHGFANLAMLLDRYGHPDIADRICTMHSDFWKNPSHQLDTCASEGRMTQAAAIAFILCEEHMNYTNEDGATRLALLQTANADVDRLIARSLVWNPTHIWTRMLDVRLLIRRDRYTAASTRLHELDEMVRSMRLPEKHKRAHLDRIGFLRLSLAHYLNDKSTLHELADITGRDDAMIARARRAILVRALLESDDVDRAITVLLETPIQEDRLNEWLRLAFDEICFTDPRLRHHGWPGMDGRALALRCAWEALMTCREDPFTARQRAVVDDLLRLIDRHHQDDPVGGAVIALIRAALTQDRSRCLAVIDDLEATAIDDYQNLNRPLMMAMVALRSHLNAKSPILPFPRRFHDPTVLSHYSYRHRRYHPVPHRRLNDDQRHRLEQYWRINHHHLPPVTDSIDARLASQRLAAWRRLIAERDLAPLFPDRPTPENDS